MDILEILSIPITGSGMFSHLFKSLISFGNIMSFACTCVRVLSSTVVSNSLRPYELTCQALQFVKFSRQVYWSWLPFPTPGDLPDQEIEPASLASPALAGGFFTTAHAGDLLLLEINENENTIFLKLIGCNESNDKKESNGCKYLL